MSVIHMISRYGVTWKSLCLEQAPGWGAIVTRDPRRVTCKRCLRAIEARKKAVDQ